MRWSRLWRLRVQWAYPASIAVLLGFAGYQIHRYMVAPSDALIALTLFDLAVIALIWRDYRTIHQCPARPDQGPRP